MDEELLDDFPQMDGREIRPQGHLSVIWVVQGMVSSHADGA